MTGNADNQQSPTNSADDAPSPHEVAQDELPKYLPRLLEVDSVLVKCTDDACDRITKHFQVRVSPTPNNVNFPPEAAGEEGQSHLMEITRRLLMCSQCGKTALKK